jgi:hypothetical protein
VVLVKDLKLLSEINDFKLKLILLIEKTESEMDHQRFWIVNLIFAKIAIAA